MRKVYYNGKFVDEANACISVYDSALMFGDMIFEMTRSFNKNQFKLREHLDRLYASAKYLRIDLEEVMTKDQMECAIQETIKVNESEFGEDDEHRIMIDVTRGLLSIYEGVVGTHKGINIIIADFPLRWTVRGMGKLFKEGINAVIPSQRAIPASLIDPKVKNRSRNHKLKANMKVSNYEGDRNWPWLLDKYNYVAEGTGDNFFIVKNGVLLTPEPRNILRGISRDYIFQIAQELEIEYRECNLDVYDVVNADEAFMSGTPFCILPVTSLDNQKIGSGTPGPVFHKLIEKWSENVNVDIVRQIERWNEQEKDFEITTSPYSFKK